MRQLLKQSRNICVTGALLLTICAAYAVQDNEAKLSVAAPPTVKAGVRMVAQVSFDIPSGFHAYAPGFKGTGIPIAFELVKPPKGFKLLAPIAPGKGELSGHFLIKVPIAVPAKTKGAQALSLAVTYQQCNDQVCLPPKTVTLAIKTTVK